VRTTALLAAACLAFAGCARPGPSGTGTSAPAPRNPDLTAVTERFYGLLEGEHFNVAYGMLTPTLQHKLSREQFDARYRDLDAADVAARQATDRVVAAEISVPARNGHAAHSLRERITYRWSGDDWSVEAIDPER
jgi:hypothetical protein